MEAHLALPIRLLRTKFHRRNAVIFFKYCAEISCVGVAQLFGNRSDRKIRIGKQTGGMVHFQLEDIFTETHAGTCLDDPLELAFAVIEKSGEFLERNGRKMFLHIF